MMLPVCISEVERWALSLLPLIASIATIFSAIASVLIIYLTVRKAGLERRLRHRTEDCLSFWEIEKLLCDWIANGSCFDLAGRTPDAIKRVARTVLRAGRIRTPSDDANPAKLNQELEKLK